MCQLLVQANANEPLAHTVYGDFLMRDKKWEEAKVEYSKAKELGAKDFLVYNQLMFIYVQLADWKSLLSAIQSYKKKYDLLQIFRIKNTTMPFQL